MKNYSKLVFSLIIFTLVACSGSFKHGTVIHTEQTGPPNYFTEGNPVEVVDHDEKLEKLWDEYDLSAGVPNVDFEEYSILVLHTTENSCPKKIKRINLNEDGSKLSIVTKQEGQTCNDIGIPRSFVVKVEKGIMNTVQTITVDGKPFHIDE